jgi:hypothetical protein
VDDTETFLAHHGVLGMHWGIRRGNFSSRVKGIGLDRNQRELAPLLRAKAGKATYAEQEDINWQKYVVGEKTYKENLNTSISDLKAQRKRIETGKMTVLDKLQTAFRVPTAELLISVQDAQVRTSLLSKN